MSFSGPLFIAAAAILWGLDGILRRSVYSLQPVTIVFYEHLIGALVLLPFVIYLWRKEHLTRREWWAVVLVSLLSGVLGTLFFTTALVKVGFISFSVVYLLQKLQPVFTMFFASLVLKEKLTRHYYLWSALAIVAAYFVTFPGGRVNFGGEAFMAALFALLAAIAWASSTAFSRYTLIGHSNTFITGLRFVLTTLLIIPFIYALGVGSYAGSVTLPSQPQLLTLLAITFSSGMVAMWLYYRGLKTTSASVSTIVELLFPLTAVVIDIFLYKSVLQPSQYLAAAVLLFAVYNVARLNRKVITLAK